MITDHVTSTLPASSPTSLTSLLTNLLYQPPHQPPYQPLPLAISKMECKAKDHVYIWDLYPTIRESKFEFLFYQALNTITQVLLTSSCNPSYIIPNLSICATLLSTISLLPPPYCNPSCCPLASWLLHHPIKQL